MEVAMSWGEAEFLGSGVNDKRESKSLAKIADRLLMNPELSFSRAVGEGLRRAAWRIFSKQELDVGYGHYKQTAGRCQDYETILVSQDRYQLSGPLCHCWLRRFRWAKRAGACGPLFAYGHGYQ
jgi:hypothetical protein